MADDAIGDLVNSLKSERIQLKSERIQLKSERIQERLEEVLGWVLSDGEEELAKTYQLSSNRAAAAFVQFVAQVAEDMGHEPHITIMGSKVEIRTKTGDVGGLSDFDFDLAGWIDGR